MKIKKVIANNRKRTFEVFTRSKVLPYPYALVKPSPTPENKILEVSVDRKLGNEGFTYSLQSGEEGTVHIDHVLEYNKDPDYLADMILYDLTLEIQRRVKASPLTTRELIRKLGTSAAQFYRLLDQTNYRKSIKQMLSLLYILDCEVNVVVKERRSA